jgi:hypothetical protein
MMLNGDLNEERSYGKEILWRRDLEQKRSQEREIIRKKDIKEERIIRKGFHKEERS